MLLHNRPTVSVEEEQAALRVLRSGWLAQGSEVQAFEEEVCEYLGLPSGSTLAVGSGTAALFLALRALDAKDKTVAFPAYVCSSLRHAVGLAGARECLIDNAPRSPNVDLDALQNSGVTIAIVPHMYGLPVNVSKLSSLEVIEDCAQALGAKVHGKPVGLQGRLSIFSFYATKLMTSGGQGGMAVSRDRNLIEGLRDFREFDCRHDQKQRFNFQMTDLQAAIGRAQFKKLPDFLSRRASIFEQYQNAGLNLVDLHDKEKSFMEPVRYRAILKVDNPGQTIAKLASQGIKAINPLEDWELLGTPEKFPKALEFTKTTVSLPLYPSLSNDEVAYVISKVRDLA